MAGRGRVVMGLTVAMAAVLVADVAAVVRHEDPRPVTVAAGDDESDAGGGDAPSTTVELTSTITTVASGLTPTATTVSGVVRSATTAKPTTTAPPVDGPCDDPGPAVTGQGLWAVPPAGGDPRRLLGDRVRAFAWSPDGSRLGAVVQAADDGKPGSLVVVDRAGTRRDLVTDRAVFFLTPAWSPDGGTVLFATGTAGYATAIFRVPAAGGSSQPVYEANPGVNVAEFALTRDGQTLVFTEGGHLKAVPAAGGQARELAGFDYMSIATSPDSRRLATIGEGKLAVGDLASGTLTRFSSSSSPGFVYGWAPDSAHVAFSRVDEQGKAWSVVARADGTNLQTVGRGQEGLSFSPDGRRVVVADGFTGPARLVVADVESGASTPVLDQATGPAWSPAGDAIAVVYLPGGGQRGNVCLVAPNGSTTRRLAAIGDRTGLYSKLTWSPSGDQLAFATLG